MPILLQNDYLLISTDSDAPIVRSVRTELAVASYEFFVDLHDEVLRHL